MLYDLANLGPQTCLVIARVPALLSNASLLLCTLIVASTSHDFETSIIRISNETRWAEFADRFVTFYDTRGVSRTRQTSTGILTFVIDTCLMIRTSSIFEANGNGCFAFLTTHTNGFVIEYPTYFAFRTGLGMTRSLTYFIDTRQMGWTSRV